jgi:N-acetylneuraminic acid mutarotase
VLEALEDAVEKGSLHEKDVDEEVLRLFLGESGRKFYREEMSKESELWRARSAYLGD